MSLLFCSICRQEFDTTLTKAMPFCSERCRSIDFGRWVNEEHAITVERDAELSSYFSDEQATNEQ
jgi:uncharacterized protein